MQSSSRVLTILNTRILQKYGVCGLSSKMENLIKIEINDVNGIAILSMNRPPVNALSLEMLQCFHESIQNVEENHCRGLIITSSYDRIFTAGLDIKEMYKPDKKRLTEFYTAFQDSWLALYDCSLPTAALISGHSPAGGCVFATCCDYRVMLPNFTIGLNETQLGLVAPNFVMSSFCNVLQCRSAELALTQGKLFTSEEAFEIGLVDKLAQTKEEAFKKCENFLTSFRNTNPLARTLTKRQFRALHIEDFRKERFLDLNDFVSRVIEPSFQIRLGVYLDGLKKRSKQ